MCSDGKIKIYDLLQTRTIYTLSGHQGPVNTVAFSPKGEYAVTGGQDNHILVWKLNMELEEGAGKEKVVQEVYSSGAGT